MSEAKTAVVGVGYLGRFHAQKHKQLGSLIGVCDYSVPRAEEVAKELGVKVFSKIQDLVGQVQAVTVASDTNSHFEISKFLLSNGIHVLVEKPITVKSSDARELVNIARKNNLVLQVGHSERFNPAFMALSQVVNSPRYVEIQRLAPFKLRSLSVDVVLDLMIHDLDLVRTFTKSEPSKVIASGQKIFSDFNDIAQASIEFFDGFRANIIVSRSETQAVRKMTLIQDHEVVVADLGAGSVTVARKSENPEVPLELKQVAVVKSDALLSETEAFISAFKNKTTPVVSGVDGLEALKLAEQVLEQIRGK